MHTYTSIQINAYINIIDIHIYVRLYVYIYVCCVPPTWDMSVCPEKLSAFFQVPALHDSMNWDLRDGLVNSAMET